MGKRKECNNQSEKLVSWLVQLGGSLSPSLFLHHDEDYTAGGTDSGLSLMVKEGASVTAGESVMRVPMEACMSIKTAYSSLSNILPKDQAPQEALADDEILALHLMAEKGKGDNSHWAPFVNSLPSTFDTPLYWTDEQLDWLGPGVSNVLTSMLRKRIENDWEDIHLPLVREYPDSLGGLTLEDYRWALSCVWSRAIGYYDSEQRYLKIFVPMLSAANHDSSAASFLSDIVSLDVGESTGDDNEGGREMWNVAAGRNFRDYCGPCEFFILYGQYTNTKLLYTYGFVLPDNPWKGVDWWMRVPNGDRLKTKLLEDIPQTYDFEGTLRLHVQKEAFEEETGECKVRVESTPLITLPLMRTIRAILATPEELAKASGDLQSVGNSVLTPRNEAACYAALRSMFQSKVTQYDSALESLAAVRANASSGKNADGEQGKNWKRMDSSARRIHCAKIVLLDEKSVFEAVTTMLERGYYIELNKSMGLT